jgi:hypothetical protein
MRDLSVIREEVFSEYQWFKEGAARAILDKEVCEKAKRKRLLYLFVKDLSSGVCGDVLGNKDKRDRVMADKVSLEVKVLGWLFVALLNLGMLVYVYLFAMSQTESRQVAWFQSFVIWLIFDLFVASTGAVFVTHLLIPLYILSDIRTIKKKVMDDIVSFQTLRMQKRLVQQPAAKSPASPSSSLEFSLGAATAEFNSAKYLFTSFRVASLFREVPESESILQFQSIWPKKSYKRQSKKVAEKYVRKYAFLTQALSRVFIFFLSTLLQFPLALQDTIIHLASNSGLGYMILLFVDLYEISPLLPLAPIAALMILTHFILAIGHRKLPLELPTMAPPSEEKEKKRTIARQASRSPRPFNPPNSPSAVATAPTASAAPPISPGRALVLPEPDTPDSSSESKVDDLCQQQQDPQQLQPERQQQEELNISLYLGMGDWDDSADEDEDESGDGFWQSSEEDLVDLIEII